MFGQLNETEIEHLLTSQVLGRIGCHADGRTYVVPISFAYDGKYIYGHTEEGMKIDMMRRNPAVCFEVDTLANMANWQSIICQGEFEELTNTEERNEALKILLGRKLPLISSKTVQLSPHWPFPPEELANITGIVYRIALQEKTGRFEKEDKPWYYAS